MRNLRTEQEIMATWKGDVATPVVSIDCITYNHELYIEDALEGFLIQDTDFPIEVLIHDDASTDRTPNIIRQYEAAYPHIIKPVYQTYNQYSQGKHISTEFNFTRVLGKYIAMCEGDDFWIDSKKLQKQINYMNKYKKTNISFHPSLEKSNKISNANKIICYFDKKINFFPVEKVIEGGGSFMPTSSIVFKKECLLKISEFTYNYNPFVGDLVIQSMASLPGGALFIPDVFSCYRRLVPGSWSDRNSSPQSTVLNMKKLKKFYMDLLEVCPQYKRSIYKAIMFRNILTGMSFLSKFKIYYGLYFLACSVRYMDWFLVKNNSGADSQLIKPAKADK